jgi:hypothetical protein
MRPAQAIANENINLRENMAGLLKVEGGTENMRITDRDANGKKNPQDFV